VTRGRLLGVGVGPGDPELLTLKAVRVLQESPVVAYVSAEGRPSMAHRIAAPHLRPGRREINIALPMEQPRERAAPAYDEAARRIGVELEQGHDVAVLCAGDPLLYGSFNELFDRLGESYPTEVVPGVTSFAAAAATARAPLVRRTETLAVLPATLPMDALAAHLAQTDAAVILKLGPRLGEVRALLQRLGMVHRAIYVEHASEARERVARLGDLALDEAPYFSLILLPAGPSP
jgi:precorrin-2/cobalt-factor-2 C20-methyltransferase